jgi:predicted DNA-binding WGR domain protein
MADPIQLPLFPDAAALTRIRPERNEWRFYRLAVWPDLFSRALLARHWGRIGTPVNAVIIAADSAGSSVTSADSLPHIPSGHRRNLGPPAKCPW